MRRILTFMLGLSVLFSGAAMESVAGEPEGDHHEHEGISDAAHDAAGHHHGDEDDHHESPDDPCHHHVVHCCCSHAHLFASGIVETSTSTPASERLDLPTLRRDQDPFVRPPFHVPIA